MNVVRVFPVGPALLAVVAALLLFADPALTGGVDVGAVGFALLVAAAWSGLAAIAKYPRTKLEGDASPAEMQGWLALAFTIVITAYAIAGWHSFQGPAWPASHALSRADGRLAMIVVAWTVGSWLLRRRSGERVQRDERDRQIETRAGERARIALTVGVFAVVALLAFTPEERLAWATPLRIAHLLIVVWLVSCVVEHAATVAAYWRDRR